MAATTETCANCGTEIGKLETPHVYNEHVVCEACMARLQPPPLTVPYATPVPHAAPFLPPAPPPVQLTERTSKRWKLQILLAIGCGVAGVILSCAGLEFGNSNPASILGALLILAAPIWFICAVVGAWWNHG